MSRELWVAGYPSLLGGADTELDHNLDLWRLCGLDVHLVPMWGQDPEMRAKCDRRGCHTHEYAPDLFAGKKVVSFCNGNFLERLPEIMAAGRPEEVIWFNCMTRPFPLELRAHQKGWIDRFGFVSAYQESLLRPRLEAIRQVNSLTGYRPFYHLPDSPPEPRPVNGHFNLGRISRDDATKFSDDMWRIFGDVLSPVPTKVFILGWGPNSQRRCGIPPRGLDWMTLSESAEPVGTFYGRLHCLIHKTGGSRESYCRVVPEAYAHGLPVIVEDDFAFREIVVDGETGFCCSSSAEMSFRASQLAFDEPRRLRMARQGWELLRDQIADVDQCWEAWHRLWS